MNRPDRKGSVRLVTDRPTPIDPLRKAAFRLKRLAPISYRKAVREGRLPQV